ncbi:unnamed protein product [Cladocopium goreaui]|uniref:Tetratricopeptide repeat protein n=1 Tax=Cladocopium goreaui TaxID=2562237 RepID=A0A9P1BLZ3_9DINO|nr:unnamed protein product [Cladocopium goreaui]
MKRRRSLLSLVALGASGAAWAVPRRWLLPAAALGAAWPAQAQPAEEDVAMMQNALSSVRRIGDFPSKAALSNAEDELTALLARWRRFAGQVAPNELPAILRNRAAVKLRGSRAEEALADLDEALELCKKAKSDQLVQYDEMPKVLIARGGALRALRRYSEAVKDYDLAGDLFGEPDLEMLSGRAQAKVGLQEPAAAAEDFDAAAELLRLAGRRPEAEIEAERGAVQRMAAEDLLPAEEAFAGVIRRSVGLLSKDMGLLQRVVLADSDARMAMTAISWHKKQPEIAEAYWRDGCDRLTILADEATGKNLALGFADGDVYNCTRYASDSTWIREVRGWPQQAIGWFEDFLRNRDPSAAPRESYVQDLMAGKRPGEGSTLMDLAIATDVFRRSDPLADIQKNLQRDPLLQQERERAER